DQRTLRRGRQAREQRRRAGPRHGLHGVRVSAARARRRRAAGDRGERAARTRRALRGALCAGRDAGPLRGRARRLAGGYVAYAADVEDRNEKHIVTPGRILPARELLGDMLLQLKRPADALKEFETVQAREPERFRTYYGAAQAAAQSGDKAKARRYFAKLVEL